MANSYGNQATLWNLFNPKAVYNPEQAQNPTSDIVGQQNGVANWAQKGLGINASTMSEDELNNLNSLYERGSKDLGNRWEQQQVLDKNTGQVVASHDYYHAPFDFVKDVAVPAALVWGGGYLGANALFGGAGAGAGGVSGMDLAADAAAGTGNNIATAGSQLGGAGGIAGTGIPQFAQQPGYGNTIATMADANGASPFTGATGSGVDNMANYLTSGASEGSTLGNVFSGAGGASNAVGSGTFAGALGSLGGAASTIGKIPGVNKVGGNLVTNMLGSVLGGGKEGGVSTLGNLGSLFTNYNQYSQNKNLINDIKGIYSPDGPYAKYLGEQLARKDAQAGRNSQYGPRLAELMGRLGDSQARALSGLGGYMSSQQGGLNGLVGAGSRLFDSMGGMNGLSKLFQEPLTTDWSLGPNGGPQMPTEDLDNWDLFGG